MNTAHNKNFSQDAPMAPSEQGAAGSSVQVARADHVHPIGDEIKQYVQQQIRAIADFSSMTF